MPPLSKKHGHMKSIVVEHFAFKSNVSKGVVFDHLLANEKELLDRDTVTRLLAESSPQHARTTERPPPTTVPAAAPLPQQQMGNGGNASSASTVASAASTASAPGASAATSAELRESLDENDGHPLGAWCSKTRSL